MVHLLSPSGSDGRVTKEGHRGGPFVIPSGSDARVRTEDHWKVTADDARRQDNRDKTTETTMRKHNIPDIG